jgi:trimeric autotransporter adhesin
MKTAAVNLFFFSALLLSAIGAWAQCSPIVVDLNKDGIDLGPAGRGVSFDVNADGYPELVQWVRPGGDEAFIALDRNRNGLVDDGSELFGVGTPLFEGGKAANGFVGLAQYDQPLLGGNDDGMISRDDAIWPELSMWLDSNADGIAAANEMRRPEALGLRSFGTIPKVRRYIDAAGNSLPYWSWARTVRPPRRAIMVDVYFLVLKPATRVSALL